MVKEGDMAEVLSNLLDRITSREDEIRQEAVFQLALLLERSQEGVSSEDSYYVSNLPPELLIRLDEQQQAEVVRVLSNAIVLEKTGRASLFWLIGKVSPPIGITSLLGLIVTNWKNYDEETIYQALIAIENYMMYCIRDSTIGSVVVQSVQNNDPTPTLQELVKTDNARYSEIAGRVLDFVRKCTDKSGSE